MEIPCECRVSLLAARPRCCLSKAPSFASSPCLLLYREEFRPLSVAFLGEVRLMDVSQLIHLPKSRRTLHGAAFINKPVHILLICTSSETRRRAGVPGPCSELITFAFGFIFLWVVVGGIPLFTWSCVHPAATLRHQAWIPVFFIVASVTDVPPFLFSLTLSFPLPVPSTYQK